MAVATMTPQQAPEYPAIKPGMMGMYIFLASEVMFFGSLFAVYFYLFGSHIVWPPPPPSSTPELYVSWWPIPFVNTIILLSSGVTGHFASEAIAHDNRRVGVGGGTVDWELVDVVWIFLFGILYLGVTLFR